MSAIRSCVSCGAEITEHWVYVCEPCAVKDLRKIMKRNGDEVRAEIKEILGRAKAREALAPEGEK